MQSSALCRSRRELSNAYLLAKFGFDTAENEPCKVCPIPQRVQQVSASSLRGVGAGAGGREPRVAEERRERPAGGEERHADLSLLSRSVRLPCFFLGIEFLSPEVKI